MCRNFLRTEKKNPKTQNNQTPKPPTKQNSEGDMDFIDGCHSGFPRLAETILSRLKIKILFYYFFPARAGFLTHNIYFSLENGEPKNESLE